MRNLRMTKGILAYPKLRVYSAISLIGQAKVLILPTES